MAAAQPAPLPLPLPTAPPLPRYMVLDDEGVPRSPVPFDPATTRVVCIYAEPLGARPPITLLALDLYPEARAEPAAQRIQRDVYALYRECEGCDAYEWGFMVFESTAAAAPLQIQALHENSRRGRELEYAQFEVLLMRMDQLLPMLRRGMTQRGAKWRS